MNGTIFVTGLILLSLLVCVGITVASRKGVLHWLPAWCLWAARPRKRKAHSHVLFCFVDHYEPRWGGKRNMDRERSRVQRWVNDYPPLARSFTDSDGQHPKHSFFFPAEEYEPEHLDALESICAQGLGELEIHLHHDNDTSAQLTETLLDFAGTLHHRHGALSIDPETGQLSYAFIHGNWVLDNSHRGGRWCGVNDEISVLRNTGCYADFTFPCAPHHAQPKQVNSIYYATDDPGKPKSHDRGTEVSALKKQTGDLMLITGPLTLNWRRRKFGLLPRIENADIRSSNPPTQDRVDYWVKTGICIEGRPDWIFVKVHTHGAPEREADTLLGAPLRNMHQHLTTKYNDGKQFSLHYVTAREMYNITKAAEDGRTGNPGQYRDYRLPPPRNARAGDSIKSAAS